MQFRRYRNSGRFTTDAAGYSTYGTCRPLSIPPRLGHVLRVSEVALRNTVEPTLNFKDANSQDRILFYCRIIVIYVRCRDRISLRRANKARKHYIEFDYVVLVAEG